MLNQLSNLELWLIMGLVFVVPTTVSTIIMMLVFRKKVSKIEDYSMMTLIKCDKIIEGLQNSLDFDGETNDYVKYLAQEVDSLSSSNEMILRNMQEGGGNHQKKVYPRPQLANEIAATIREQIGIELIKSKNLRAPSANYLHTIVKNVSNTYPGIDVDYIANKCIAIMESMGGG